MSQATKKAAQRKAIERQIDKLQARVDQEKQEVASRQKSLSEMQKSLDAMTKQLGDLQEAGPVNLTDHAIVRYLERVCDLNLDEVATRILDSRMQEMIDTLGNGKFPITGTPYKAVVRDRAIVTVV